MPITMYLAWKTPDVSEGVNPTAEFVYIVDGSDVEKDVRAYVRANTPDSFDVYDDGRVICKRDSIHPLRTGRTTYTVAVKYSQFNTPTYAFDTTGSTQHIVQALATVGSYGAAKTTSGVYGTAYAGGTNPAPDFGGYIPEGVDITVPTFNYQEVHYFELLPTSYIQLLFQLTGKVCNAPFKGIFAAGEGLFLGAQGTLRQGGDWEVLFKFAGSVNQTGLKVGDVGVDPSNPTGPGLISKRGWEYLWVHSEEKSIAFGASKLVVKVPISAQVVQVLPYGNFSALLIG